ncbi:MAG TPA: dihydrofolate reductase [Candidatus Acidoferrales bacterium]|nr:dihydrofolate reductase [Candidatus Acidoferrales bacterium]
MNRGRPRIALVAACDRRWGIGRDNHMPWHLPADLAHFKALTLGHAVVMGARTYAAIGRALPGRQNLVLSRDPAKAFPGAERVGSVEEALAAADSDPVMVIGGGQVYGAFLPLADEVFLTRVDTEVDADAFFPALTPADWTRIAESHHSADAANPHAMRFEHWARQIARH